MQGFGSYWLKSLASIDFILVEGFDYSFNYHKKKRGVWARLCLVRFIIAGFACCKQKKPEFNKQAEPAEINTA